MGPNTTNWTKRKHPLIATPSINIATSAAATCELLAAVPLPSDEWLSPPSGINYYYRTRHISTVMAASLSGDACIGNDGPATEFFVTVFWPSVLLYQKRPSELLQQARNGDIESLDQLLRLDKRALLDPRVSLQVAQMLAGRSAELRSMLAGALSGRPRSSVKPAAVKAQLAACMIELSQWVAAAEPEASALTSVDTRDLLDAVHRDQTGELDLDLPESKEAWAKAVYRATPDVRAVIRHIMARTKIAPPMSE